MAGLINQIDANAHRYLGGTTAERPVSLSVYRFEISTRKFRVSNQRTEPTNEV